MSSDTRETTRLGSRPSSARGPRTEPFDDDRAQLVHAFGRRAGQRIQVEPGMILGRDQACDVVVDDEGTSRRHARLGHQPGTGFIIEDLGSRNGTFVNGVAIDRTTLAFGDKIAIGANTVFLFTRSTPLDDQVIQAQKLQMLGELAGGIVHDFNNILGAFTVGIDVLRSMCGHDEQILACLHELDHAAARGSDLASQLLGFARGGATQHEPVSLSQIATDGVRLLRRMVPMTITLQPEIEPKVGVHGSSSQLLQVIVNLSVNSADAMPEGGEILIRVARQGEHAVLEVVDTGEGMDAQILQHAREPFFTTKPRGHGTGLGLATVDRVAREHHGTVELASTPGRGTTVTVRLPFVSPRPRSSEAAARGPALPPGVVVLLVDDDPVVRTLTVRMLEASGAEVFAAADGLAGVELFRQHVDRIDVVLLDMDLPRLSGGDTFLAMHELQPRIPVLIASGYLFDERIDELRASGARGFLSKPFRRGTLLSTIVEALGPAPLTSRQGRDSTHDERGGLDRAILDPITLEELQQLERSEPGFLADLVQLYLDETPKQIDAIEQVQGDARVSAAHQLKSASLGLGVTGVAVITAAIESAAREGEACDRLLSSLRHAFEAVRPALEVLVADPLASPPS